jgi:hypothetical protein
MINAVSLTPKAQCFLSSGGSGDELLASHFREFTDGSESASGVWEMPIYGWLLAHVPVDSPYDQKARSMFTF